MEIECPECKKESEVEGEDLPHNACDEKYFQCTHCGFEFLIGWYAIVELR